MRGDHAAGHPVAGRARAGQAGDAVARGGRGAPAHVLARGGGEHRGQRAGLDVARARQRAAARATARAARGVDEGRDQRGAPLRGGLGRVPVGPRPRERVAPQGVRAGDAGPARVPRSQAAAASVEATRSASAPRPVAVVDEAALRPPSSATRRCTRTERSSTFWWIDEPAKRVSARWRRSARTTASTPRPPWRATSAQDGLDHVVQRRVRRDGAHPATPGSAHPATPGSAHPATPGSAHPATPTRTPRNRAGAVP